MTNFTYKEIEILRVDPESKKISDNDYFFDFTWSKEERRQLVGVSLDNTKVWPESDHWFGPVEDCPYMEFLRADNQRSIDD